MKEKTPKYTLDNIEELLLKIQSGNRKLREIANIHAVLLDRALLRLEIIIKERNK